MKPRLYIPLLVVAAAITLLRSGLTLAAPSIGGIWDPAQGPGAGHPPAEDVSLTAEGQTAFESFSGDSDPTLKCIMPGVPLGILDPYPLEIIQQDHQIVFLHEHFHMVRRIFTDRTEPPAGWWPSLVGFSTGSWEGNTLVVKTTHMSPDNLMWHNGMPFSGDPEAYAIERYEFDDDKFVVTAEVFDPRYYDEPYVMRGYRERNPDGIIFEYECFAEYNGAG